MTKKKLYIKSLPIKIVFLLILINIGFIFQMFKFYMFLAVSAAQEAQEAVNLNDSVLRDYRLEVQVDDGRCEADFVLKAFIDQIFQQRYNQLVGILGK